MDSKTASTLAHRRADSLTPNRRREIAAAGARALHEKSTPLQRQRRARKASEAAATLRRLIKLIQITDAEAEGWKDPEWIE